VADERSAESIALTLLVIAEVPNMFSGLLPSLFTIGTFTDDSDADTLYWIRRGEVNALGLSLTLGLGASIISKQAMPFIGTALMSAFLIYHYEHALRNGKGKNMVDGARDDT
jgi:hypothetical protein